MKIFSSQDELLLNVEVDDSSYRHRVIKGENNIVLKYSLSEHVELPVGSYCIFRDSVTPSKIPRRSRNSTIAVSTIP